MGFLNHLNLKIFLLLFYFYINSKLVQNSSIESCLSSQGVDLTQSFDIGVILPVECQCTTIDVICINSKINDPSLEPNFPSLWVLFMQENSTLNYLLPKQRFTFFGYGKTVPNAFKDVKFVYTDNKEFNNQHIFIDFLQSYNFVTGTFNSFGNLENINKTLWPKIYISIDGISRSISFEKNSFSNMFIDTLSIKYIGNDNNYILSDAFNGSYIKKFEIRNTNSFFGFTQLETDSKVSITSVIIDECSSFVWNEKTLPGFDNLTFLSIRNSVLKSIPKNAFNLKYLETLSLNNNKIMNIEANNFEWANEKLLVLDLSNNNLINFDWKVFSNFKNLVFLDLSNTNISTINSFERIWPSKTTLRTISLKNYLFNNDSICYFESDLRNNKIDLSQTFIELDKEFECNCFVFYLYKDYRQNQFNNLNDWILNNKVPACYQNLFLKTNDFVEIQKKEEECNFKQLISRTCLNNTTQNSTTFTTISTTTSCTTTLSNLPGITTVIIGNQTTITTREFSTTTFSTTTTTEFSSILYTITSTSTMTSTSTTTSTTTTSITSSTTSITTTQSSLASTTNLNERTYTSEILTLTSSTSSTSSSYLSSTKNISSSNSTSTNELSTINSSNNSSRVSLNTTSIIVITVLSVVGFILLLLLALLIFLFVLQRKLNKKKDYISSNNESNSMINTNLPIKIYL